MNLVINKICPIERVRQVGVFLSIYSGKTKSHQKLNKQVI